jgi:hypothetical protein
MLVIGAGKAGTTSLHEYLDLHPEIRMSEQKELRFFEREHWRDDLPWYEQQFASAPVRGESSPTYTMYPNLSSTAERIAELLPDARLIYVVRDPVERAIASYVQLVALRRERRPIAEALTDLDDPTNPHICGSRYATQLERFLARFPAEQILVIDHHDLLHERARTLAETFRFLGVDPTFTTPAFDKLYNTRETKVRYNDLGWWLISRRILTQRNGPFRNGALLQPFRSLLSSPIDRTPPASARETLAHALRPEVDRLRLLTGKPFAHWPAFPGQHR